MAHCQRENWAWLWTWSAVSIEDVLERRVLTLVPRQTPCAFGKERQHLWSCHEVYLSCPKHHPTALAQGTGCLELCFKYKELQERWLSANSSFGRKTFSKIGPECYFSWKEHITSWAFVFCILCRFPFSPCKVSMFLFHWCKYPLKALIELALMSTLMSCWKFRAAFEMLTKMSVTLFHKL